MNGDKVNYENGVIDSREINDIIGTDQTRKSMNSWDLLDDWESSDGNSRINNFRIQYETKDTGHERHARIIDDPTFDLIFEDDFENAYLLNEQPHLKLNDLGKRNWNSIANTNASVVIQTDPIQKNSLSPSDNYVLKFESLNDKNTSYPRVDKIINVNAESRIVLDYRVFSNQNEISLDIFLPGNELPAKRLVSFSSRQAFVDKTSVEISGQGQSWNNVRIIIDILMNTYTVSIDGGASIAGSHELFPPGVQPFSTLGLRFTTRLQKYGQTSFLDDVVIKKSKILFSDGFDFNYQLGDQPHVSREGFGRINWSAVVVGKSGDSQFTIDSDEKRISNKVLKIARIKKEEGYPRIEKDLELFGASKLSISYRVMTKGNSLMLEVAPSMSLGDLTTPLEFQRSRASILDGSSVDIVTSEWTDVRIELDLYNNNYIAYVNGKAVGSIGTLFKVPVLDYRKIKLRFTSKLEGGNFYYLDNVQITVGANSVMRYFGGDAIHDSKVRIASILNDNKGLPEIYFKYRVYFDEGFARYTTNSYGIKNNWFTLGEFFDGSCWNWVPEKGPNYASRVSFGIANPESLGGPLRFEVQYQKAVIDSASFTGGEVPWKEYSTVTIPVGQWVTIEGYLKQGVGVQGKFEIYMTGVDGKRQPVFNITGTNFNKLNGVDGITHIQPMKMYGHKYNFTKAKEVGNDLRIYWDDFELRTTRP